MNSHFQNRWGRRDRGRAKEKSDKALILLMEERGRLLRAKWNAPYVELEEPFQRGWVRFFVLNAKAKHKKDAKSLEELLGYFNSKQHSRRRDFRVRQGRSKKWIPMEQKLPRLHVHEILRRNIPERLFRYLLNFKFEPLRDRNNAEKLRRAGYPWKFGIYDPSLFELVIEPYLVTHQKIVMPEVESRLSEIERTLDRSAGWQRYARLKGHRRWRLYDYQIRLDEQRIREYENGWRDLGSPKTNEDEKVRTTPYLFSLPVEKRAS